MVSGFLMFTIVDVEKLNGKHNNKKVCCLVWTLRFINLRNKKSTLIALVYDKILINIVFLIIKYSLKIWS